MCVTNNLQRHIRNLTNDGEVVARFLVDTVQAKTPGVKPCHQVEAMKYLVRFGLSDTDPFVLSLSKDESASERNITPSRHSRENGNPQGQGGDVENPPLPQGEGWGEGENILHNEPVVRESEALVHRTENSELKTDNSTVSHLDILNYDIAHLIRRETADGHTIVQFLAQVMTGPDKPFTPKKLRIRHTDRMAAAREVLRRGFGHFGRKRKLVHDYEDEADTYDTLHTDLAKRMREYTEHGTDAVRFLLDVMADADPDDPYTWHHRVSAAQELIRRGWDTNYEAITPELLQAYWQDQPSTRLSTGQKKHLAGLRESREKVPFVLSVSKDESASSRNITPTRRSCGGRSPEEPGAGTANPNPFVLSLSKGLSKDESARQPKTLPSTRSGDGSSSKPEPRTNPPLPQGEGWGEGESLIQSPSPNQSEIPNHHSLKASPQPRSGSGTPAEQSEHKKSSPSCTSMSVLPDPDLDCYYEPLNPNDQAIFDHELRLETGDLPHSVRPEPRPEPRPELVEGPVEGLVEGLVKESVEGPFEPSPEAWRDYELALAQIREAAASEGIPLLPNPLAGTLKLPTIRSP